MGLSGADNDMVYIPIRCQFYGGGGKIFSLN